jgi:uncharacterized membrane-anchored protein YitT (DUF2179 family)
MKRRKQIVRVVRDYVVITLGALILALAVTMFLTPNDVIVGGVLGAGQLANNFFGLPTGVVVLVLNIPLFVLGFRELGGFVFGIRTIYATVVMSLAIDGLQPYVPNITADPLLYSIYGGLLDGIGTGLVLRAGGTTGGVDILARYLEKRFGVKPGQSSIVLNASIFGIAFFAFGPENVLYALLVTFIAGVAIDYTLAAGNGSRQAIIITSQPTAITQLVLSRLGRGITVLEGHGGYTGESRAVLLCVLERAELGALKQLISSTDPQAFVVIGSAEEVLGEGFRPVPLVKPLAAASAAEAPQQA